MSSVVYRKLREQLDQYSAGYPTTESGNYSQTYIKVNVTASDSGEIDNITIYLYNSTELVVSNISSSSPFYWEITDLPDGTYYLNATVNDSANNINNTPTRIIILDTQAPTWDQIPNNKTIEYAVEWLSIDFNATDPALDQYSLNDTNFNISEEVMAELASEV